jgi:hypothetical protein
MAGECATRPFFGLSGLDSGRLLEHTRVEMAAAEGLPAVPRAPFRSFLRELDRLTILRRGLTILAAN